MEKRRHTFDDGPDEKRSRFDLLQEDEYSADEAEFYVEQRLVGWILGKRGATLKEIEEAYLVKVVVDQADKSLGYSKVKITGSRENWQAASEHINQSLARAEHNRLGDGASSIGPFLLDSPPSSSPDDCHDEEMKIEQRYVGWLLGKGGGVVREIEQKSGCKISINQDKRGSGYSRAIFQGNLSERQLARQMIKDSVDRAKAGGSDHSHGPRHGPRPMDDDLQIDQKWVGWLLGKGGGVAKEIEEGFGVRVSIDQSTKSHGYSTIKINGDPSRVQKAKERIQGQLQKVGGTCTAAANSNASEQVEVEQKWVGWLLGKSGTVMKEIEQQSGASIKVDQSTKDSGYSTVRISGSFDYVATAKNLVMDKIAQVDPEGAHQPSHASSRSRRDVSWTETAVGFAQKQEQARAPSLPDVTAAASEFADLVKQLGHGHGQDELAKVREIAKTLLAATEPGAADPRGGRRTPARGSTQPTAMGHIDLTSRGRPPLMAPKGSFAALRAPAPSMAPGLGLEDDVELTVEQKLVGYILGSRGATMRDIEAESGAKVSLDQSTKDLGYSLVKIAGSVGAVQLAQQRIQKSLARAEKSSPNSDEIQRGHRREVAPRSHRREVTDDSDEIQVDQKMVGWLLGSRGVVMKEIEVASGARISIDQSTKDAGFSTVQMFGSAERVAAARVMVWEKIAQANPVGVRPT